MRRSRVLVDAGPLVAISRPADEHHNRCSIAGKALPSTLFTCWPVISEAMWLLRDTPGAQHRLLDGFNSGILQLLLLGEADVPAIQLLHQRYSSLHPDLADLCLVRLANREGIRTIFTLDRRDFSIYRYRERSAFQLVPD